MRIIAYNNVDTQLEMEIKKNQSLTLSLREFMILLI